MTVQSVSIKLDGRPATAGGTVAALLGGSAVLAIHPDAGGWPVLPGAPRTPFVTLMLADAGLATDGASVLGQALQTFVVPLGASGQALHPLAFNADGTQQVVTGPPGGTLVAVRLPYGFTTATQPPDILVRFHVTATATGTLPVVVGIPDGVVAVATRVTVGIDPAVALLDTLSDAPEGETAGSASQQVTVLAHLAPGAASTNVALRTTLPASAVFEGAGLLDGVGTVRFDPATGVVSGQFSSIQGLAPRMVVRFHSAGPFIGSATLDGNSRLDADWTRMPDQPAQHVTVDPPGLEWQVVSKPVALHSVAAAVDALAPGRALQWTLTGLVSGGGLDGAVIADTLGNGQHLDTSFAPQLTLTRNGAVLFSGTVQPSPVTRQDGMSAFTFDVSQALAAAGFAGSLSGSTIEVVFRSEIDQLFGGSRAPSLVGQGDTLTNTGVLQGSVAGAAVADATTASATLPTSSLGFTVYAVNGEVLTGPVHAAIGDAVTYRALVQLPLTRAGGLAVLAAGPGPLGTMAFDAGAAPGIPLPGHAQYGPDGSYAATPPAVQPTADGAIRFDFGPIMPVYGNGAGQIDLLYTTMLSGVAADPGTPQAQAVLIERNTDGGLNQSYAAANLAIDQPALRLQAASIYVSSDDTFWTGTGGPFGYSPFTGQFGGVINSDGLAAEPFHDQLWGVDAGDEVTFVVAVESVGRAGAYGLVLQADMPDGFGLPDDGADISVVDGNGTPLPYSGDLFGPAGLALDAAVPVRGYDPQSGQNVVLVIYTLRATQAVRVPEAALRTTARILAYRSEPAGPNLVGPNPGALAVSTGVTTAHPTVSIALASTSADQTTGGTLAIGETATFAVTATLPEGTIDALDLRHLLPNGLEFLSADVVQVGANILLPGPPQVSASGGFSFGRVVNVADNQVDDDDRIQLAVTVRARSATAPALVTATLGATNPNDAAQRWSVFDQAEVSVVEPRLTLDAAAPPTAQTGQVATFTLRLANGADAAPAFDVRLTDVLASGLTLVRGSAFVTGTLADAAVTEADGGLAIALARLDGGETLRVTFQARVAAGAAAGASLGGTAAVTSASLPGGDPAARTDRTGASAAIRVVTPAIAVSVPGSVNLPVGGVATYRITAILPEGVSPAAVLRATLPAGLAYAPGSARVVAFGAGLGGTAPAATASGQRVSFDLGAVNAAAIGDRSITVELRATVSASAALGSAPIGVTLDTGYASVSATAALTIINTPPTLTALPALQVTPDDAAILLFAGLRLSDPDGGQTQTVRITMSDPGHGTLYGAAFDAAGGTYRITGSTTAVAAALAGLRFLPTPRLARLGEQVQTRFTIEVQDSAGGLASAATTVAAVTGNTAPTIAGTWAGQSATTRIATVPFSALVLADRDAGQVSTLSIRLSDPASGKLVPQTGGAYDPATGVFRMTGLLDSLQQAAHALAFVPAATAANIQAQFTLTLDDGAGGVATDSTTTVQLKASVDTFGIAAHYPLSPNATFLTVPGNGGQTVVRGETYQGPVDWLRSQFIYDGNDTVAIVAQAPDVFIKSFSGFAAIKVASGRNVVDAGPGSNFILGGSGADTFFLDGSQGQVVWDTITGFSAGDAVTLFGWRHSVSTFRWDDNAGATGFTGRTLRADLRATGQTTASLTFAGTTAADTNRYSITEGKIGTIEYLAIVSPP